MENDSIRASGSSTLVDVWVNGKLRAICVTSDAIETFLGISRAKGMSEDERCEFVRGHLPQLVTAVKAKLRDTDPNADCVVIDIGQFGGRAIDRRKGERRKGERRKSSLPRESLPHGERRRGDRRNSDRRRSAKRSDPKTEPKRLD
jgi:hypothetical protein